MLPNGRYNDVPTARSQLKSPKAELNERVMSWLRGVHTYSSCGSPPSARSKHRRPKPYSRPAASRRPSSESVLCLDPVDDLSGHRSSLRIPPTIAEEYQRRASDCRTPSFVQFRGIDDLPEPEHNPLITLNPEDIEEEYRRVILLYNRLEEEKQHAELRWLRHISLDAMENLMDIGATIQRVIHAAQYIVDYSHYYGFNVDFQSLFFRNHCPPLRTSVSEMRGCNSSANRDLLKCVLVTEKQPFVIKQ